MNEEFSLPGIIVDNEKLARIISAGSTWKSQKKRLAKVDETFKAKPSIFLDERNPMELSVNRISTITIDEAHSLGLLHSQNNPKSPSYTGFAQIVASIAFTHKCEVKKDDVNGTKPYHANIIYPSANKEDCMEIAVKLSYNASIHIHATT